ncbi:L-amino acid N-acyltransferase YncA [Kineococcus xinjiangensis]|uniref:L-amino acid N-acyltransferase YncA n=1 Tax=Kineococcus xinjiangensis TaxID=512762 RepID=A0A2S6IPB3_9ACTN|nr:GNAT family N-acetyltransferase [Kineococcus xinjiangensis]PPK96083.1 L-amino acid N-acyltransferase YncA [Kineococcus xinjiangensis]
MARPPVEVRLATTADVDALMELYQQARYEQVHLRTPVEQVRTRLDQALRDGAVRVLLATVGERPAGYALLSPHALLPLTATPGPCVEHLHVVPEMRRRGVGRCLLRRALAMAQEEGAEELSCTVLPQDREYTRYMARLGFAPVVVRRAAPLAVLRRRLFPEDPATEDVLARRRSLRGRLARAHAAVVGSAGASPAPEGLVAQRREPRRRGSLSDAVTPTVQSAS